ncbi:hypothetical protein [Mycobacterium sp.]|uniref:hypothetical protein n=1 Tax=Mycobacterium sp. TaxID=1785 RepID=UPI003C76C11A
MQSPVSGELNAAPLQLVAAGTRTDSPLSATRFLSAADNARLPLPTNQASATVGETGVFTQIATPPTDNQIHDEHLVPADEQWRYRREQLASSGRCPTVTI